jgi:hypothetical protein
MGSGRGDILTFMKEGIPEAHGNTSIHNIEGELVPHPSRDYPYNHYKDPEGKSHFGVTDSPKEQFIASQLASLEIPVANVFNKEMPHGEVLYFSSDVKDHSRYEKESEMSEVNRMFLEVLFNDDDHDPNHNHDGTIFYDFGLAMINHSALEAHAIERCVEFGEITQT